MRVLSGIDGLRSLPPGAAVSVGNYDGVHLGHGKLLEVAARLRDAGAASCVSIVTFEPHPLTRLRPAAAPPRLTTRQQKERLLQQRGVDYLVELPPEPQILSLRADAFWQLLAREIRASHLVEGEDFTFGKGAEGEINRLRAWCEGSSLALHVVAEVQTVLTNLHIVDVHSNLVRWLIEHGRVRDAAICLGHPYEIEGVIVKGLHRGKAIGMPTANFDLQAMAIPADGVYAARCRVDGRLYPSALSVGTLPTFGEHKRQVEAHLIGFEGDLYGRTLRLEALDWLRDQRKYASVELLKQQMARDLQLAASRLEMDPARPVVQVA